MGDEWLIRPCTWALRRRVCVCVCVCVCVFAWIPNPELSFPSSLSLSQHLFPAFPPHFSQQPIWPAVAQPSHSVHSPCSLIWRIWRTVSLRMAHLSGLTLKLSMSLRLAEISSASSSMYLLSCSRRFLSHLQRAMCKKVKARLRRKTTSLRVSVQPYRFENNAQWLQGRWKVDCLGVTPFESLFGNWKKKRSSRKVSSAFECSWNTQAITCSKWQDITETWIRWEDR